MTTPAENAATVREALDKLEREERLLDGWNFDPKVVAARCAALDALEAQAEAALDREAGTADALDEMRAERDRLHEFIAHTLDEYGARMPTQWKAHARAALATDKEQA